MGLKCGIFPQVIHRSAGPDHCVGARLGRSVPALREWRSEQPQRSGGEDSQAKNRPAEYLPRTRGGHTPRSEVPHFLGLPGGMGRHAAPGPSGGSGVRKLGTNDITTPNAPTEHGFTRRQHPWMSWLFRKAGVDAKQPPHPPWW
jgi:hypothetical protein